VEKFNTVGRADEISQWEVSSVIEYIHPVMYLVLPPAWVSKKQHIKHGQFLEEHIGRCFTADPTGPLFLFI
jgi:hypothetical protein